MSDESRLTIYVNSDAKMSRGKYAAHAIHAALTAFGVHHGGAVIVLGASRAEVESKRIVIRDAGRTELGAGTVTAGTDWSAEDE